MALPTAFLSSLGRAIVESSESSVLSDLVAEATPELAEAAWQKWDAQTRAEDKLRELEALVQASDDALDDAVAATLATLGLKETSDSGKALGQYLRVTPSVMRGCFARPSEPAGTVLPRRLELGRSRDLLALLPPRSPWFTPGDRPWGIGDWELRHLVEMAPFGEVWRAANPERSAISRPGDTAIFYFFLSAGAKNALKGEGSIALDRAMMRGNVPGVIPVQQIHIHADPPCVQYAGCDGADLAALIREWNEIGAALDPVQTTNIILQAAEIVGRLHRQESPLVHGNLSDSTILIKKAPEGWQVRVAGLGLGRLIARHARPAAATSGVIAKDRGVSLAGLLDPYAAPEVLAGQKATTASDVYSLGILWHQLLRRDVSLGRPGGGSWRRKLAQARMPTGLIEVLESCFEDDPAERPADAAALAHRMRTMKDAPAGLPVAHPVAVNVEKPRRPE